MMRTLVFVISLSAVALASVIFGDLWHYVASVALLEVGVIIGVLCERVDANTGIGGRSNG
jgi:hypothetical protein